MSTAAQKLAVGHETEVGPPLKGSISLPCDQPDALPAAGEAAACNGSPAANIAEVAASISKAAANRRMAPDLHTVRRLPSSSALDMLLLLDRSVEPLRAPPGGNLSGRPPHTGVPADNSQKNTPWLSPDGDEVSARARRPKQVLWCHRAPPYAVGTASALS